MRMIRKRATKTGANIRAESLRPSLSWRDAVACTLALSSGCVNLSRREGTAMRRLPFLRADGSKWGLAPARMPVSVPLCEPVDAEVEIVALQTQSGTQRCIDMRK
jgi:hypothetical protein